MKKLNRIALAAAGLALSPILAVAGPAPMISDPIPAAGPEFYVFGFGGLNWAEDYIGETGGLSADLDTDNGWAAGGGLGLRSDFLGGSRFEVEGTYRSNDVSSVLINGNPFDSEGEVTGSSVMANFIKEIPLGGLRSYAGIGIGYANVDSEVAYGPAVINDSDGGFAWQAIAGLELPLADRIAAYVEYRYLVGPDVSLVREVPARTFDLDFDDLQNHIGVAGIRVFF